MRRRSSALANVDGAHALVVAEPEGLARRAALGGRGAWAAVRVAAAAAAALRRCRGALLRLLSNRAD